MAVCAGTLSLEPEERVDLLATLARDGDPLIVERAANALLSHPEAAFRAALARPDAATQLLHYCAEHLADKPGIADAVAAHANCPPEALRAAAAHLSVSAVQALLEDLERLSQTPSLAAALAASPILTAEQRLQLHELQEEMHLDAAAQAAMDDAVSEAEPDQARRQTLLQRLARMRVVERVQLALKGGREERIALIRDPCKVVQRGVLQSPRISDREVESFSAMASLSDEVLRLIANNRKFRKNYIVTRNLLNNPKTPLDVSLHMLPMIQTQDLKLLTMNKNIPETLRTMAIKLQRQRKQSPAR